MERQFLLFDAGCGVCREIAERIGSADTGSIEIRSLRDPEVLEFFSAAGAEAPTEPARVTFDDAGRVSMLQGWHLRRWVVRTVGPIEAIGIWRLARRRRHRPSSAERRRFLQKAGSLGVLALFAPGMIRGARASAPAESRAWQPALRIRASNEVEGEALARLVSETARSGDARRVGIADAVRGKGAKRLAVRHELEDGNELVAVSVATPAGMVHVHYQLRSEVEGFKSGAFLYRIDEDEETIQLVDSSVNGSRPARPEDGFAPASHCGSCVTTWMYNGTSCQSYNWGCVFQCCGSCGIACLGGPVACFACLVAWCPVCSQTCCSNWQHVCHACSAP